MGFKGSSFIFTIIFLYIGAFLAGLILNVFQLSSAGWTGGLLIGLIQVAVLGLVGIMAKFDLWTILIGAFMVFIGGVVGGLVAEFFGAVDLVGLIIVLVCQTLLLMATGLVKSPASPNVKV